MSTPTGILWLSPDGTPSLQVSDRSIELVELQKPMTQRELELCQFERFQAAARRIRPDLAVEFDSVPERDPPDFRVSRDGKTFGLDMAAFMFTERRKAFAQFRRLKDSLREAHRAGRLRTCGPLAIQIDFGQPAAPLVRLKPSVVDELVEAFEKLTVNESTYILLSAVDREAWTKGKAQLPFPLEESGAVLEGSVKWHVEGLAHPPLCSFAKECGFQLEQMYLHTVTQIEVSRWLDKLVKTHADVSKGIHELVIVAGGPDLRGDGVFDESMIASTFIETWKGQISRPTAIHRVFLYNWIAERLDVLYEA